MSADREFGPRTSQVRHLLAAAALLDRAQRDGIADFYLRRLDRDQRSTMAAPNSMRSYGLTPISTRNDLAD